MIWTYAQSSEKEHLRAMPLVTETYDGVLNNINGQHITEGDALAALDNAAAGPLAEGNVGDEQFDPIDMGAVETIEETVINAMLAAEDIATLRPAGNVCRAIDGKKLVCSCLHDNWELWLEALGGQEICRR